MNYTVTISISRLLAPQKTLIYRISVRPSEVLVRPSDLCPANVVIGSIQVSSAERSPRDLSTFFRLYEYPRYCKVVSRNERLALDGSANLGMYFRSGGQRLLKIHDWPVVSEELGADGGVSTEGAAILDSPSKSHLHLWIGGGFHQQVSYIKLSDGTVRVPFPLLPGWQYVFKFLIYPYPNSNLGQRTRS